jgi:hypothetical protein
MAVSRNYSSVAQPTTLTGNISSSATSVPVASPTGFPAPPFTAALDYGAAAEELVEVTAASLSTWTVTRGIDGTSAQSHSIGAVARHVTSARDSADSRAHEAATAAVHGVAGTLVGTSDTQTLANKTLTAPVINGATASGTLSVGTSVVSGTPTFSGAAVFTGAPLFRGATTGDTVASARVSGDTNARLAVGADGKLVWGSGAGAGDTVLYREAADVLTTDDTLRVYRGAGSTSAINTRVTGDTVSRLSIDAAGTHNWGPGGAAATDTNLYRTTTDTLRTDDSLQVGTNLAVTGTTSLTGALTLAGTLNLASSFIEDATNRTTTSTSFVNSSGTLSTTLVVPPSGKVLIVLAVRCDNSGNSNTLSDYNVSGTSSGTIYSAQDASAIQWNSSASAGPFMNMRIVTGSAGETITVTAQHRVVANTGNLRYRSLLLQALAS